MSKRRLKSSDDLLAEELRDDEQLRLEWERLEFSRAIAARIIEYRARHDLSQTQLAKQLGVTQPQVHRWESGEHNVSDATLTALTRLGIKSTKQFLPSRKNQIAVEVSLAVSTDRSGSTHYSISA